MQDHRLDMAPYATYGAGTKQAAIENMDQINGSLTALSGPKQVTRLSARQAGKGQG